MNEELKKELETFHWWASVCFGVKKEWITVDYPPSMSIVGKGRITIWDENNRSKGIHYLPMK